MKRMVRDDIISRDTFAQCAFEHHSWLKMIHNAGGYVLMKQFEKHFENGRYILDKMIKDGVLKAVTIKNHKFVVLTTTATKYLRFWDSPEDFSDKAKNTIPAQVFTDKPTQKQLFTSVLKFELILKDQKYGKEMHLELVRVQLSNLYSSLAGTGSSVASAESITELELVINTKKYERNKLWEQYTSAQSIFIHVIGDEMAQEEIEQNYTKSKNALDNSGLLKGSKQHEFNICKAKFQTYFKFKTLLDELSNEGKLKDVEIGELKNELNNTQLKLSNVTQLVNNMISKTEDLLDNSKILVFIEYNNIENYGKINVASPTIKVTFEILNFGSTKSVSKYLEILMDYQDMLCHGGVREPNEQKHLDYRTEAQRLARKGLKPEQPESETKIDDKRRKIFYDNIFIESQLNIVSYSEPQSLKIVKEFTKRKTERDKAAVPDHKKNNYEKELLKKTPEFAVSFSGEAHYLADVLRNAATQYHSVAKAKDRTAFEEVENILNLNTKNSSL